MHLMSSLDAIDRRTWVTWSAGLLVAAIGLYLHRRVWTFTCDDAYISFRYARNLAEFGALTFDVGHVPPVEGYTNFLWVVLLAAGMGIGIAPELCASVLGFLSGLAILGFVFALVTSAPIGGRGGGDSSRGGTAHARRRPVASQRCGALCVGMLLATPMFVVWTSGGLETSTATLFVLGAVFAGINGRLRAAALLSVLGVLTRPDAVVPLTGAALGCLLSGQRHARPRGSKLAHALLIFVVPLVLHMCWRRWFYDAWLPHTWEVKRHGASLARSHGARYLWVWGRDLGLMWWLPLAVLLRRRHLVLAVPVVASVGYVVSVGGDFMAYGRFLQTGLVLLVCLVGWLATDISRRVGGRAWTQWRGPIALASLAVLLGASGSRLLVKDRASAWQDGMFESVAAMDRFARVRVAAGEWMRENLPSDLLVSVGAAGAMPYASGLSVVDTYGLVERDLSGFRAPDTGTKARPGHQLRATLEYVKSREPDLLCHLGYAGPQIPPTREARRRGRGDYRWACIPVGEIALPLEQQGLQDVGTYCCLRRESQIVGPFGGTP